jgi:hypothetical protein
VRFNTATGTAYLDARLHFRDNNTNALFYVRFEGVVKIDAKISLVMSWSPEAATSKSSDHYHFIHPIIETSSAEHKWLEETAFVGHGHYFIPGDGTQAVEFEIYKLVTG